MQKESYQGIRHYSVSQNVMADRGTYKTNKPDVAPHSFITSSIY